MVTGVLLLAAGSSRRFGTDKRYARLASGETVMQSTIRTIQAAELPLLVCLSGDDARTAALLRQYNTEYYRCAKSSAGMGATLAGSIGQVTGWSGVLIGLADMPFVQVSSYRAVARGLASDGICVPRYAGVRGHPVGFGRLFFPALAGLSGDVGASKLLHKYASSIRYVDVDDVGIQRDIDQPEDLG